MNSNELSIVVPVFNGEKTIEQCINSIRNQTFRKIELIIVDDGSTDGTLNICQKIAQKDDRIVICHKANGGVSSARNTGIELATGQYLMFIDGDDILRPDYIKAFMDRIDLANEGIIVLSCIDVYQAGKMIAHEGLELNFDRILPRDSIVDIWKAHLWNPPWNRLYNTELLKHAKIKFDESVKMGEDWLFNNAYARCFEPKGFYLLGDAVYDYYMELDPWRHCSRDEFYSINKKQCEDFKATLASLEITSAEVEKFEKRDLDFTISEIRYLARGESGLSFSFRLQRARQLASDEQVFARVTRFKKEYSKLDVVEFGFHSMIVVFVWENTRKMLGRVRKKYA